MNGIRVVRTFSRDRNPGPVYSFNHFSNIVKLASTGLSLLQILVGDTFLLYRMAAVWGRDLRIYVFPLVLLVAGMGMC